MTERHEQPVDFDREWTRLTKQLGRRPSGGVSNNSRSERYWAETAMRSSRETPWSHLIPIDGSEQQLQFRIDERDLNRIARLLAESVQSDRQALSAGSTERTAISPNTRWRVPAVLSRAYRTIWFSLGVLGMVWGWIAAQAFAAEPFWISRAGAVFGVTAALGLMVTAFVAGSSAESRKSRGG